jgi:flagellar protein FliS
MTDPTSVYRTVQVVTSTPAEQIVLLYQGAIRFAGLHVAALERGEIEAAHAASLRAQAIVSGLQEVLEPEAGRVAENLDRLYTFALDRLVAGNMTKTAAPTREAVSILAGLLEAWQTVVVPATRRTGAIATPALAGAR